MAYKPPPPRTYTAYNGELYWRTQWYDDQRKRRTKTFGNAKYVSETQAMIQYREWLADWLADPSMMASQHRISVQHAAQAYIDYARDRYAGTERRNNHSSTVYYAVNGFAKLFRGLDPNNLRPRHIEMYRQALIDGNLTRSTINKRLNILRRWSRWCVSKELMPTSVREYFWAVDNLRLGELGAREAEGITPVSEEIVARTLERLPPTVAAIVEVQLQTAMRPGEVLIMRPIDIDTAETPWLYVPGSDQRHGRHKNAWRGHDRRIYLGPQARATVRPFLGRKLTTYMFTPGDAVIQRRGKPYRNATARYTTDTYRQAIMYACSQANVPKWTPLQLRHTALTRIERAEGADAARAIAGHRLVETTQQNYIERDMSIARKVTEKAG